MREPIGLQKFALTNILNRIVNDNTEFIPKKVSEEISVKLEFEKVRPQLGISS